MPKNAKTVAPAKGAKATKPAEDGRLTVTTFRITRAQWEWLRRQAFERSTEIGGKADASALLREILEVAMNAGD